jgi:RimJ/RimL family protein N-acetyltransferase
MTMPQDSELQTPSLILRHFVPEDAPDLLRLNAEETTREGLPSHVYRDLTEVRATVSALISSYSVPGDPRRGPYVLAVDARAQQRLLGHVGFSPLNGRVEVSYAIAERMRGHGYGAEALSHACSWVAQTFGLCEVVAITASTNTASRRTLERAGFARHRTEVMRFQGSEQSVCHYVWFQERMA